MSETVKDYNNLPDWVQPGLSYRTNYDEGNPNNRRYHVRGIVDGRAVICTWSKCKQRWMYDVERPIWFAVAADHIEDIEPSKGSIAASDKTKTEQECVAGCVAE